MNATATIAPAGPQDVPQYRRALERANEVRLARAELKRKVAFGEIDVAEVILYCPWEAQSMAMGDLLMSQHRWGQTRCRKFLSQIPWTGEFRRVPEIAYAHHEKMDGTGYPRKLAATDIPVQSRMMTISDIFDALVAWDRPYKKSVPVERALDILRDEARGGKLDMQLLDVFVDAKVYERTLPRAGAPAELAR